MFQITYTAFHLIFLFYFSHLITSEIFTLWKDTKNGLKATSKIESLFDVYMYSLQTCRCGQVIWKSRTRGFISQYSGSPTSECIRQGIISPNGPLTSNRLIWLSKPTAYSITEPGPSMANNWEAWKWAHPNADIQFHHLPQQHIWGLTCQFFRIHSY